MEAQAPSPQTTLLILLGASAWPFSPEFASSQAFAHAARRLKAYFLNPRPFGLPVENLLDLFDSDKSADELDAEIGQFLGRRLADLKQAGHPARDLLLYFIGHGGFVGHDADLYFAIRRTRMDNPRVSGLPVMALADTLTEHARFLRRIIILDCCFAAAAFSAFQSGPDQVALEKAVTAFLVSSKAVGFPAKGTTLLCSSSHKSPSLLLPDGSSTMFTKAFLDALIQGTPSPRDHLTLRYVKDLAANLLTETRNAPRPVVLSPDQSEGDVADIPFFPNPRAQEERVRQAEEEHARKEEEWLRRAEEERVRQTEEQVRKAEPRAITAPGSVQPPETPIIHTPVPPTGSIRTEQSLPPTILAPMPSPAPSPTRTPRKVSRRTVLVGLAVGGALVTSGGITWWVLSYSPNSPNGPIPTTITGTLVSVNAAQHSVVLIVNGQQVTVSGLTDQQVAALQTQVGKVYTLQVTGSGNSYTIVPNSIPQPGETQTPVSNTTQPPTTFAPESIQFMGTVRSISNTSTVVSMPDGSMLTMSITSLTDRSLFGGGLPSTGQLIKVQADANPDGSFTAAKLAPTDANDVLKQNIVQYNGVTTSAVGADQVIHFNVGTRSYSFTIGATTDLSNEGGNAQAIQANQPVTVQVQFAGSTATVLKVAHSNG